MPIAPDSRMTGITVPCRETGEGSRKCSSPLPSFPRQIAEACLAQMRGLRPARLPRRIALGKPDAARRTASISGRKRCRSRRGGRAGREFQRRRLPLLRRRAGGAPCRRARMDGQDVDGAEALAERSEKNVEPVGAEDDGEAPAGLEDRRRRRDPLLEPPLAEDMGVGRAPSGEALPAALVERRIHQHLVAGRRPRMASRSTISASTIVTRLAKAIGDDGERLAGAPPRRGSRSTSRPRCSGARTAAQKPATPAPAPRSTSARRSVDRGRQQHRLQSGACGRPRLTASTRPPRKPSTVKRDRYLLRCGAHAHRLGFRLEVRQPMPASSRSLRAARAHRRRRARAAAGCRASPRSRSCSGRPPGP